MPTNDVMARLSNNRVKGNLGAAEDATEIIKMYGYYTVSILGTWVGTITLERALEEGRWGAVDTYTANEEAYEYEPEPCEYRLRMSAYTSGTASVILSRCPGGNS